MTITAMERAAGWVPDATTFGARLALIRQHMGWGNIEKAAKACGISTETWRSWERDNREPHRLSAVARQIATATGCDYLWLLAGPDGGGGGTTRQYFEHTRTVATVGDPGDTRRPVRRTSPVARPAGRARRGSRPVTAVAA